MLILESKSPCSMSYDEEQLYFLGVEFNDDWTVRSGPIRKLKGKCSQGFCRWQFDNNDDDDDDFEGELWGGATWMLC